MLETNLLETTKEDVLDIVKKYEKQLSENGISIAVSKRYFETKVDEYSTYNPDLVIRALNRAERRLYRKREKIYKNQPNRYHAVILTVLPSDKSILKRELCRDYAFVLSKTERAHKGLKPEQKDYEKQKIIAKIEKRIKKIINRSSKLLAKKVCKDTIFDVIRYTHSSKYAYKKKALGRDLSTWQCIFAALFGGIVLVGVLLAWYFSSK